MENGEKSFRKIFDILDLIASRTETEVPARKVRHAAKL